MNSPVQAKTGIENGCDSGTTRVEKAAAYFNSVAEVLAHLPCTVIDQIVEVLFQAYQANRFVFLFGNGGSAALASHLACDLGKGTAMNGNLRFRVMALTDNVPLMTAWANDSRYEDIFAEQLHNFIQAGDLAIAISGSGNSPNVIKALEVARRAGAYNIGIGGYQGGKMKGLCNLCAVVPSDNMQIIEDMHLSICHCIFLALRQRIFLLKSHSSTEMSNLRSKA